MFGLYRYLLRLWYVYTDVDGRNFAASCIPSTLRVLACIKLVTATLSAISGKTPRPSWPKSQIAIVLIASLSLPRSINDRPSKTKQNKSQSHLLCKSQRHRVRQFKSRSIGGLGLSRKKCVAFWSGLSVASGVQSPFASSASGCGDGWR
jgi:hypothetical protein